MYMIWKLKETYFISMLMLSANPLLLGHFRNYKHPLTLQIILVKEISAP